MIIEYNYLDNENQVLCKAQTDNDEMFILNKAKYAYIDSDTRLTGIISVDNLIISFY